MSDPTGFPAGSPLATLRRISTRPRPAANEVPEERCDMCAEPVPEEHGHVVDLNSRRLMCSCRGCYLLFTADNAELRFRAVPDRYLHFPGFVFTTADWDSLQIPVGLAFCFRNSVQKEMVVFYPSPAGATESDLPMAAWETMLASNPDLAQVRDDVEALLVHRNDDGEFSCHIVPIDACYALVGTMRNTWRGFDGGQEARAALADFFDDVDRRSRPAKPVGDAQ
ncbi:MAG: hypothetical protein JWR35_315 [Marmoricola sp.]|jgi:hypothetical protein|nr:hypothetical protein [Marmoricola sp.]